LELQKLQRSLVDTKPIGPILNKCVTLCQAKVLLRLLDVSTEKSLNTTCSLTAARGRGKSAALGLAIAGAIGFGFTNIFVTSPSVENLRTLFEFVLKGFDAIGYMVRNN
jgi:N-acetyltransferase 10